MSISDPHPFIVHKEKLPSGHWSVWVEIHGLRGRLSEDTDIDGDVALLRAQLAALCKLAPLLAGSPERLLGRLDWLMQADRRGSLSPQDEALFVMGPSLGGP